MPAFVSGLPGWYNQEVYKGGSVAFLMAPKPITV